MLLRVYLERKFQSQRTGKLFVEKLKKKELTVKRNDQHQIAKDCISDKILNIDKDNSGIAQELANYCLIYRTPFEVLERHEIEELQDLLETELRCVEKIKKEVDELLYYPFKNLVQKPPIKDAEKSKKKINLT